MAAALELSHVALEDGARELPILLLAENGGNAVVARVLVDFQVEASEQHVKRKAAMGKPIGSRNKTGQDAEHPKLKGSAVWHTLRKHGSWQIVVTQGGRTVILRFLPLGGTGASTAQPPRLLPSVAPSGCALE